MLTTLGGIGPALFIGSGPLVAIVACVLAQGAGMCWPFVVKRIVSAAAEYERDLTASAAAHGAGVLVFSCFIPVVLIGCLGARG